LILAGPCRLPVDAIVRIILPIPRAVFIAARRRNCEIARKIIIFYHEPALVKPHRCKLAA